MNKLEAIKLLDKLLSLVAEYNKFKHLYDPDYTDMRDELWRDIQKLFGEDY